jgi:sugar (pentulose or hexulose) kinase
MAAAIKDYCAQSRQQIPETFGDIARCVFESLSFAYRNVAEDLERFTDRSLMTIRIVGGGCLIRFLCQMTADACGRRVIAGPVEAAALGNAIVQAMATGHISSLSDGQAALKKSIQCQTYLPVSGKGWQTAFEKYKSAIARGRKLEHISSQA